MENIIKNEKISRLMDMIFSDNAACIIDRMKIA